MRCANCKDRKCYTDGKDCTNNANGILKKYTQEDLEISRLATSIESRFYKKFTRLEEIIVFSEEMGYKRLGIAFCIGLSSEAKMLTKILEKRFHVDSVVCKCAGISKDSLDFPKIDPDRYESICNPIGQADILNRCKTDLNIALGLCIGHDILFARHSKAPVTTLIVKDRVLAHNPAGALYSGYYRDSIGNKLTQNTRSDD